MSTVKVEFFDASGYAVWSPNLFVDNHRDIVELDESATLEKAWGNILGALYHIATHPSESLSGPLRKYAQQIHAIKIFESPEFTAEDVANRVRNLRSNIEEARAHVQGVKKPKLPSIRPFGDTRTTQANTKVLGAISEKLPQFVPAQVLEPIK